MTTWLFWATMGAIGLLVGALAVYLLAIIGILRDIRDTAGLVLFGVRAIAHGAAPVRDLVSEINGELDVARNGLREVVGPPEPVTDEMTQAIAPQQKVHGGR